MIIVDSSVWIDFFKGTYTQQTLILGRRLGHKPVAVRELTLTEVLQGFRKDSDFRNARMLFSSIQIFDMLGAEMALKSAEFFRRLAKKGITVRKTADVIIANFCIANKIPLLYSDKDFMPFERHLGLQSVAE